MICYFCQQSMKIFCYYFHGLFGLMGRIILLLIINDDCISSILIVILFTSTFHLVEIMCAYELWQIIMRLGQRLVLNQLSYQNLDCNDIKYIRQLFPSLDVDYTRAKSLDKKEDSHEESVSQWAHFSTKGHFPKHNAMTWGPGKAQHARGMRRETVVCIVWGHTNSYWVWVLPKFLLEVWVAWVWGEMPETYRSLAASNWEQSRNTGDEIVLRNAGLLVSPGLTGVIDPH